MTQPRSGRAAPLPPDERRAAILRAVRPVLFEKGAGVTTRELARAAGVAEGTLFRVFEDKAALVREAALAAADPADDVPAIRAIDPELPLETRLRALLHLGYARMGDAMRWMGILHEVGWPGPGHHHAKPVAPGPHVRQDGPAREPATAERMREFARRQQAGRRAVSAAVVELLKPDEARFGRPLEEVVALFEVLMMGATVQEIEARRRGGVASTPSVEVLVEHFLTGALAPTGAHSPTSPTASSSTLRSH